MKIAIIGTRIPGLRQAELAALAARYHSNKNDIIVTGGALGIDSIAIENSEEATIILPWLKKEALLPNHHYLIFENFPYSNQEEAFSKVAKLHPSTKSLSPAAWKLHGRNWFIVKGSDQVLAFPSPPPGGGTNMGIIFAKELNIPIESYTEQELQDENLYTTLKARYNE